MRRQLAQALDSELVVGELAIDGALDGVAASVSLVWDGEGKPRAIAAHVGDALHASELVRRVAFVVPQPALPATGKRAPWTASPSGWRRGRSTSRTSTCVRRRGPRPSSRSRRHAAGGGCGARAGSRARAAHAARRARPGQRAVSLATSGHRPKCAWYSRVSEPRERVRQPMHIPSIPMIEDSPCSTPSSYVPGSERKRADQPQRAARASPRPRRSRCPSRARPAAAGASDTP